MRRALALLFASALTVASGVAGAEVRRMAFKEKGRYLVVSGSFTDVFNEELFERLSSGFATNIVVRFYVYRRGVDLPVAFSAATMRVIYDVWAEVYTVRIEDLRGTRELRARSRAEALNLATRLRDTPLSRLGLIKIGPHYELHVVVEVNPISEEHLAEVRRWLARPAGRGAAGDSGSFFGAFVSVFVNPKLEEAERVLKFKSQPFYRVPR